MATKLAPFTFPRKTDKDRHHACILIFLSTMERIWFEAKQKMGQMGFGDNSTRFYLDGLNPPFI